MLCLCCELCFSSAGCLHHSGCKQPSKVQPSKVQRGTCERLCVYVCVCASWGHVVVCFVCLWGVMHIALSVDSRSQKCCVHWCVCIFWLGVLVPSAPVAPTYFCLRYHALSMLSACAQQVVCASRLLAGILRHQLAACTCPHLRVLAGMRDMVVVNHFFATCICYMRVVLLSHKCSARKKVQ